MEYLPNAERQLADSGIGNPRLDVRLLVQHALRLDGAQILAQSERVLSADELAAINVLLDRRMKHEPVARILGERGFWNLTLGLNEATLEPRPDTETVVEVVLKYMARRAHTIDCRVLDLGTGTGCLLLALLSELPHASGLGIDIAPRAVEQARMNAKRNNLDQRAAFRVGNWLEGMMECFDVIVSNPPYIKHADIKTLQAEVQFYDPILALDGGDDGLDVYRAVIPELSSFLKSDGCLGFEVGQGQSLGVAMLLQDAGFCDVSSHQDLSGIDRCVFARKAS